MIRELLSLYRLGYAKSIVYMLQSTEYQVRPYLAWFWRTNNFSRVMHRRKLVRTRAALALLSAMRVGLIVSYSLGIWLIIWGVQKSDIAVSSLGLTAVVITPLVLAHLLVVPLLIGRWFIVVPREYLKIRRSAQLFANLSGTKIAIAGSYGKTSMKEILLTVLSEGKEVAATPANKNVAISHANFVEKLSGDEEVIIIEYGEGAPGDVAKFTRTTKPDIGVVTGLAPAHLDRYKTLQRAGKDIFSLAEALKPSDVYVNNESDDLKKFVRHGYYLYGQDGVAGYRVSNVKNTIQGISFHLKKGNKIYKLQSALLGEHHIGPLSVAVVIAERIGLSKKQIESGVSQTKPFEHRMQPYQLNGAWVIDDTYNGNIDGIKVGLALLKKLPATRKVYVTPGLVDQARETKRVHHAMGRYIAAANPDQVVLIRNSVTKYILDGMKAANYQGIVTIEQDPLTYYQNLKHFAAAGDLFLLQNDWTDNYN